MAAKAATAAQHVETLRLVEAHGGVVAAARACGRPRTTMQSRYQEARAWAQARTKDAVRQPEPEPPPGKPRVRVLARPSGAATRILAIGDAHDDPRIDKDRFVWIGRHIAATQPDYAVQIGDFATLDSLNSHIPNDSLRAKTKNPFLDDMASFNEALGAIAAESKGAKTRLHVTLGNHERRAWLYEDSHPEVAGHLTGELTAILDKHGWAWREYGEWLFLDGVGFSHAALNSLGKTYGGKTAEQRMANDALFDMVVGHSHVARSWRAPKIGPQQFVNVLNLGCALPHGHIEDYALHATTGWTWGVYDLELRGGRIEAASFVSMLQLEQRYR